MAVPLVFRIGILRHELCRPDTCDELFLARLYITRLGLYSLSIS
jgi:hypothetical protein